MIYEYECICCSHVWDEEQKITDPPVTTCPQCKVASAKRVISGGQGFLLKGGGWYRDGYGTSSGNSGKQEEG